MGHLKNQQRALRHRCKILEIKMLNFFLTFWGRNILDLFLKVVAELNDVQCICVYVKFCCRWSIDILVSVLSCYKFWIYNWVSFQNLQHDIIWHLVNFVLSYIAHPYDSSQAQFLSFLTPSSSWLMVVMSSADLRKLFLYQGFNWHSNKS